VTEADKSEMHNPIEILTLEQIKAFVEENLVEADDSGSECVDDRETAEQSHGRVRAFGGSLSYMLPSAKVIADLRKDVSDPEISEIAGKITNSEIVEAAIDAKKKVKGEDVQIHMHDDAEHNKNGGIGCGYAAKASDLGNEFQHEYGVEADDARELYNLAYCSKDAHIETLEGGHNAKGVLMIYGDRETGEAKFSVNSKDKDGKLQFFVADVDRTRKLFEEIIPVMFEKLGLSKLDGAVDKVWDAYMVQANASLKALAKGLPTYNVYIDSSGKPTIEQAS
jgi:hypothetical protein